MSSPLAEPRLLFGVRDIQHAVDRLGREISEDHPRGVLLVGVLNGGACFLADLARAVSVPCQVDFLALSSFGRAGEGRVRIMKDLDIDIGDRGVVLVEDIVDTGLRSTYVLGELERRGPTSCRLCTFLDRQTTRILPVPIRYRGFEIGNEYVIGYGLDFAGLYRNLPEVLAVDAVALAQDRYAYMPKVLGE